MLSCTNCFSPLYYSLDNPCRDLYVNINSLTYVFVFTFAGDFVRSAVKRVFYLKITVSFTSIIILEGDGNKIRCGFDALLLNRVFC